MSRRARWSASLSGLFVVAVLIAVFASPVKATTITVNTSNDPSPNANGIFPTEGRCSLRAAIISAMSNTNFADADCATGLGNGVLDVIQIDPSLAGQTLTLSNALGPLPNINMDQTNKLDIIGPTTNAASYRISGGGHHRIFELGFVNIGSAWLRLANLTLSNGNGVGSATLAAVNGNGGVIYAGDNTHLTLDNVVIRDNGVSQRGGGIFISSGELTSNGGAFINNSAGQRGGAIFSFNGPTTYNGYALLMEGNSAPQGGAIAANPDPGANFIHLERSLLRNNTAQNGAVVYVQPTLQGSPRTIFELTDSTATGNTASQSGGVFFGQATSQHFRFLRSTFRGNGGTAGLYFAGGGFIANSIIIDSSCQNSAGSGPGGTRNLWGGANTGCGSGAGNIGAPTGVATTLAQNGGPLVQQTYRLLAGSNAIDNGDAAWCGTIDARSVPRGVNAVGAVNSPQQGDCDIGAYEYARYVVNFQTGTSTAPEQNGVTNVQVKLAIPDPIDSPLAAPLTIPISRDPTSTARATIDYTIPPAGVTFPAGSVNGATVNLPVTILQDDIAERFGEYVIFHLQAANGVAVAEPKTHNLAIQDDDMAGVITNDGGNGTTIAEATPATPDSFTMRLQSRPDYSQPDPNDSNSYGPPADVTVTLEPDRDCTATVGGQTASLGNPISFLILNANWQVERPISVNAINDPYDEDFRNEAAPHTCTLEYSFDSLDPVYDSTIDRYDVNIVDNDVNGVTITPSGGSTNLVEGGATDTYTIVLATPPDPGKPAVPRTVTVNADPDAQCDVGNGVGAPRALTFNEANFATPQTVTITAIDDLTVELAHSCIVANLASSADPFYADLSAPPAFARTPASVTGAIQDYAPPAITNDPPFVNISSLGGISVAEANVGAFDTLTVVLERQPLNNNVTVALSGTTDPRIPTPQVLLEDAVAGGPPPSSSLALTFTPANWNVAQTVRVLAVNDDYDESQNLHPVTITGTISSPAVGFNDPALRRFVLDGGGPSATLAAPVAITDNDVSAVIVTQSGDITSVTEAGATDSYTIRLATHPYADVTVTATPNSQCDLGNGPGVARVVQIAAANWNQAVTVPVTATDDSLVEPSPHTCVIGHVVTSAGDALYNNIPVVTVLAAVTDNDVPLVVVTTSAGLAVNEATPATADTFTVRLQGGPDAPVTVRISAQGGQVRLSDALTSPAATLDLLFTPANYASPQTVSVTAINDFVDETDPHSANLVHSVISTATGYATAPQFSVDGVATATAAVSIGDDDTAGITVTGGGGSLVEGGASASYSIVLTSQPTADVTITPVGDSQCTVSGALTFTAANWSTSQSITVTAFDDPTVEPAHSCTIANQVASTDPLYQAIAVASQGFAITDNDVAGISIAAPALQLSEATPGTTAAYSIVLDRRPLANVTVTATVADGQTALSAAGATTLAVVFTPENWNTPQTVTVWVVDDTVGEATPHQGAISHAVTSTAFGYSSNPAVRVNGSEGSAVSVSIADNDLPIANDDTAVTNEDTAIDINVLANDVNPAPTAMVVGSFDATTTQGGTVAAGPGGTLRYTPPPNDHGTDSFTYVANNGASSLPATVTITVNSVNDAPSFTAGGNVAVAVDSGAYSASWASAISPGPANEAGQTASLVISNVTNSGIFSVGPALSANGTLTFTPAAGVNGTSTVTVYAADNGGTANGGVDQSVPVSFTIRLDARPTIASASGGSCDSGGSAAGGTFNVVVGDIDTQLDSLTLVGASSDTSLIQDSGITFGGSGANRTVQITAVAGASGSATIEIRSNDGVSESSVVTYNVFVGTSAANSYNGTAGNDLIFGMAGRDRLGGGAGDDLICGGLDNDDLDGDGGSDTLGGEAGDDSLNGGDGNDRLDGGAGKDQLRGGDGDDVLVGGSGADRFSGGKGTDTNQDVNAGEGDKTDGS